MTRFGLRRRLKSALGLGGEAPDPEFEVALVLPDGSERRVRAERRYTLVMASQSLETPIATGCPDGGCGSCVVDVLAGAASLGEASEAERTAYRSKHGKAMPGGERLACHARVEGPGVRVRIREVWRIEDQL